MSWEGTGGFLESEGKDGKGFECFRRGWISVG